MAQKRTASMRMAPPTGSARSSRAPSPSKENSFRSSNSFHKQPKLNEMQTRSNNNNINTNQNNSNNNKINNNNNNNNNKQITRQSHIAQNSIEESNIHVFVRCRGRNDREINENSGVVVSTHADGLQKGKEILVQTGPMTLNNKTYTFDQVFGPESTQEMIYDNVVSPILNEVISGYNCTIFAYGQTGTGKTYTMTGDMSEKFNFYTDEAGIIPRTLHKLFAYLAADESNDYSVSCSFIELYNEELKDLLSSDDDRKVKIYDDTSKKGSIKIQGMEQCYIKSASEGVNLLRTSSLKRQVAATKCNDYSSRSHTVFTLIVHVKATTDVGEEYVRTGKLNLVDLAGSENITRSGAENKRAREAGMINQSLLTLGRVINSLVDKAQHIPYRESKLTRLLQDSLGGRTKTCIVATISPAKMNLDETISTLDYASRAKNIKNKPQLNQMISKSALIRDFVVEIERLKQDLTAARQKNGVYITQETYDELTQSNESRRILVDEQARKLQVSNESIRLLRDQLDATKNDLNESKKQLNDKSILLKNTQDELKSCQNSLENTINSLKCETYLRQAHANTEQELSDIANQLVLKLNKASSDISSLKNFIKHKEEISEKNFSNWGESKKNITQLSDHILKSLSEQSDQNKLFFATILNKVDTCVKKEKSTIRHLLKFFNDKVELFNSQGKALFESLNKGESDVETTIEKISTLRGQIKGKINEGLLKLNNSADRIAQEVFAELEDYQSYIHSSYNKIGRECKIFFETAQRETVNQKTEILRLQSQIDSFVAQTDSSLSKQGNNLQTLLEKEKQSIQTQRDKLMENMKLLIDDYYHQQTSRIDSVASEQKESLSSVKADLNASSEEIKKGIVNFSDKQEEYINYLQNSKESMRQQIVDSYHQSETHGEKIKNSTKQISNETLSVVKTQSAEFDEDMKVLDEYVLNVKTNNSKNYRQYANSCDAIWGSTVCTFNDSSSALDSVNNSLEEFNNDYTIVINKHLTKENMCESKVYNETESIQSHIADVKFLKDEMKLEINSPNEYNILDSLPRTVNYSKILEDAGLSANLYFSQNYLHPTKSISEDSSSDGSSSSRGSSLCTLDTASIITNSND